jgi:hypothetical protein
MENSFNYNNSIMLPIIKTSNSDYNKIIYENTDFFKNNKISDINKKDLYNINCYNLFEMDITLLHNMEINDHTIKNNIMKKYNLTSDTEYINFMYEINNKRFIVEFSQYNRFTRNNNEKILFYKKFNEYHNNNTKKLKISYLNISELYKIGHKNMINIDKNKNVFKNLDNYKNTVKEDLKKYYNLTDNDYNNLIY